VSAGLRQQLGSGQSLKGNRTRRKLSTLGRCSPRLSRTPSRLSRCHVTACRGLPPLSRDTAKMSKRSQLSACEMVQCQYRVQRGSAARANGTIRLPASLSPCQAQHAALDSPAAGPPAGIAMSVDSLGLQAARTWMAGAGTIALTRSVAHAAITSTTSSGCHCSIPEFCTGQQALNAA